MNKKVRAVSILALLAAVVFASNQVGIQRREAALLATPRSRKRNMGISKRDYEQTHNGCGVEFNPV